MSSASAPFSLDGRTVKIQLEDDVRRVSLSGSTYEDFYNTFCSLFLLNTGNSWNTFYMDDEGDAISVTCDVELKEAIDLAERASIMPRFQIRASKLYESNLTNSSITRIPAADSMNLSSLSLSKPNPPSVKISVTHNALCDLCKQKIFGIRYKCGNCEDYDLCENCEALRSHTPQHVFLKIYDPVNTNNGMLLPNLYEKKKVKTPKENKTKPPLSASFVEDVNMPEGTQVYPGQKFVKTWKMKNDSQMKWPEGVRLVHTEGDRMGANSVEVVSVFPNESVDISVELLAPMMPGHYVSYWKLSDQSGVQFGHKVWVDIIVVSSPKEVKEKPVDSNSNSPVTIPVVTPVVPAIEQAKQPEQEKQQAHEVLLPPGVHLADVLKLEELGFSHKRAQIISLLLEHQGDLVKCVVDLLDSKSN